jgi:GT2 family glycosyltransferase
MNRSPRSRPPGEEGRRQRAVCAPNRRLARLVGQIERALPPRPEAKAALDRFKSDLAASQRPAAEAPATDYERLIQRIRALVQTALPADGLVLAVSKGDPELTQLGGRPVRHFPSDRAGNYLGYHPASSLVAIAQLEAQRAQGARYLLFPQTAFWWLQEYVAFRQHLDRHYRLRVDQDDTCRLYALDEPPAPGPAGWEPALAEVLAEFQVRFDRDAAILDWHTGLGVAAAFPRQVVFLPPDRVGPLPYLDRTVDVVVTAAPSRAAVGEARRVASGVVAKVAPPTKRSRGAVEVAWMPGAPARCLPTVSIIIPCFNGIAYTEACLRSLLVTLPKGLGGEIIVVDDASRDGTARALRRWQATDARIAVVRNARNLGFVDSCNRGARAATGEILLFLNNDTVLLPGWLPPLLRLFHDEPKAGVVGGKLILPDGTLQEAGNYVFRDGSVGHFGRADTEVEDPLYGFVREVDYCSGALLATPRVLFAKLGGFDRRFRPGYYEDADYCMRVRQAGHGVYCQPASAVVHMEGSTAGTDLARGMRRYQVLNRVKLRRRWARALARGRPSPGRRMDRAVRLALALGAAPDGGAQP